MRPRLVSAATAPALQLCRSSFFDFIGTCHSMQRVYDLIERAAESSESVLIRGENGTGKTLVAHAIVNAGPRRARPFVTVNCAAIPESLVETQLFGHDRGGSGVPCVEAAESGTLFLDDVSSMSLRLQTRLLRLLQERSVQPIRGRTIRRIGFRLIAAAGNDIENMVRAGSFREELYYRINVVPVVLPPLRERRGDIPILLDHFLQMYCQRKKIALKRVEPEVVEYLEQYSWPGNVSELESMAQHMVQVSDGPIITVRDLPAELHLIPEEGVDFPREIARIEMAYIQAALRRTKGKKVAAAALLRLNRQQLKYLCRKYRIA